MRTPSRVLMVLHRTARAGTERHVLWLAGGLRKRGWCVAIAASERGSLHQGFVDQGLTVHIVPRRGGIDPIYVTRLAMLARRLRVDVLHAHSGRVAALSGRLAGVPVVIETRHGLGPAGFSRHGRAMKREAWICRVAHKTVAVSRADRSQLVGGGLEEGRVVLIPNGIPDRPDRGSRETDGRKGCQGRIRLGFLGRFSPQKRPEFLIELADRLEERIAGRWELLIAGDGPLGDRLRLGLAAHTARGTIRWLGEIDGPDALLAMIDVLLVPSEWEGQPLSVLEAMQGGVVVIGRRIPNLDELLRGEPAAGIVLPGDAALWADAIALAADQPEILAAYAREAASRVNEHHGLPRMVAAVDAMYRESFAARRGAW